MNISCLRSLSLNLKLIILFSLIGLPSLALAQNNRIPDLLERRDFPFDFSYFSDTAIEVLNHYSPGWERDYPTSSPLIATVNYEASGETEKIVIVLFRGFERGFANVIFLVENQEMTGQMAALDQLDIIETLLIDFSLEKDTSYYEKRIPQLLQSYHMYNKYRDQINRDMKA